jgi:hypothetical protein
LDAFKGVVNIFSAPVRDFFLGCFVGVLAQQMSAPAVEEKLVKFCIANTDDPTSIKSEL